jgi:hypothetical protein
MKKGIPMADTAEIQLSLATIWEYLRARIVSEDIGPYPQKDIVIGAGVSKRKPGDPLEIARQDAQAAGEVWDALCQGHSNALNNPRLGRVLETLGYAIGLRSYLMFEQAVLFGEWLANRVTGWSDGQATEEDLHRLDRVAKQTTTFGPAVQAVLTELRKNEKNRTLAKVICGCGDSKVITIGA